MTEQQEKIKSVINNLAILRTYCSVNPRYGIGLSADDCKQAVAWLDDGIDLLKAQIKPNKVKKEDNNMSGGSLDYFYANLEEHAGDFEDKELDELVSDLAKLFHDREWYLSDDTGIGDWNEARDAFKAKWFKDGARKERIEKYISEFFDEIRKSFGISDRYCKNCKHWSINTEYEGKYSKCEYNQRCLFHRSDSCEKWEPSRFYLGTSNCPETE